MSLVSGPLPMPLGSQVASGQLISTGTGQTQLLQITRGQLISTGRGRLLLLASQDKATVGPARAPNLAVEVGVDLSGNTMMLDDDQLDDGQLLGWPLYDEHSWSNLICDVRSAEGRRGASDSDHLPTRIDAGLLDVVLLDTDRRFDPYGDGERIQPNHPMRLRAWGTTDVWAFDGDGQLRSTPTYWSEVLYTGQIDAVDIDYPKDSAPVVSLTVTDIVGELSAAELDPLPAPGTGQGDDLLLRLRRVLAAVELPHRISTDVGYDYAATLAPTLLAGSAWDELTDASDAELGRLWVDRVGAIVAVGRRHLLAGPLRGTLSDAHEEVTGAGEHCCYDAAAVTLSTAAVINRAQATRRVWEPSKDGATPEAVTAVATDRASQRRYGVHGVTETLEVEHDWQAADWADALLTAESRPRVRVSSVRPRPDNHQQAWPAVASTDIGDRWTFRMHPVIGPPTIRTLAVVGVQFQITPEEWSLTWSTVEAPDVDPFAPDGLFITGGRSTLDGPDVLAPYRFPALGPLGDLDGGPVLAMQDGRPADGGRPRRVVNDAPANGGTPAS